MQAGAGRSAGQPQRRRRLVGQKNANEQAAHTSVMHSDTGEYEYRPEL